MLSWLFVIIIAYFLFSLSYLGDKFLLSGRPKPNSYTFFVGILSIFVVLIIPFIDFSLPPTKLIFWIVAEALVYVLGLYAMFLALEKFEVSKVMTTIGATQPVIIFILTWILFGERLRGASGILAFVLLIFGGAIISIEKNFSATGSYLKLTLLASLLFSLDYVFSKIVFLLMPFLSGFIWMRIFVFLFSFAFLLGRKNRQEIFRKQNITKKTGTIFVLTHIAGGIANALQGFAMALAPVAFLPVVNSTRGVQYVFLFLIAAFLSVFFPKILKEEMFTKVIAQKIISIILIVAGLVLLAY